ncbi:MAG: hypothetical protein ACOC56_03200 [Atribacterota bacterium]
MGIFSYKVGDVKASSFISAFIITNGRSSYKYCKKSIDNQKNISFKVSVISDVDWVDANNKILELCDTEYFLRVDDDYLLHPLAVSYTCNDIAYMNKYFDPIKPTIYTWRLWDFIKKCENYGIKAYEFINAKNIGFRTSPEMEIQKYGYVRGKIDFVFGVNAKKTYPRGKKSLWRVKRPSILGGIAFATLEEQLEYRRMRIEKYKEYNGGDDAMGEYKELTKYADGFSVPIEKQFSLSIDNSFILAKNKEPIKIKYHKSEERGFIKCVAPKK